MPVVEIQYRFGLEINTKVMEDGCLQQLGLIQFHFVESKPFGTMTPIIHVEIYCDVTYIIDISVSRLNGLRLP